jgi:hypothetical protein
MVDRRRHGGASPVAGTCGVEAKSSRGGNGGNKNLGSRVGGATGMDGGREKIGGEQIQEV